MKATRGINLPNHKAALRTALELAKLQFGGFNLVGPTREQGMFRRGSTNLRTVSMALGTMSIEDVRELVIEMEERGKPD